MTRATPAKRQATRRPFDVVRRSTCGNCPAGCGVKAFLKDGRIVDLFGDEEHPANKGSFCPKGLMSLLLLDHPERVVRPRLREDLDKPFHDVGWEEALAFIGRRLDELVARHGADSCIVHGDETSPFGHVFGGSRFAERLGTANGPGRFRSPVFGDSGRFAAMFGVAASRLLMNTPRDWANSRCIVVFGSDPAVTDPITFGPMVDARDRGARLVVIDSKTTMTALKASYFVRVRPGTEAVLLAAVNHLLIANDWIDPAFVAESTVGFEAFRDAVAAYTPDRAAAACGIAEDDVHAVARVIGTARPVQVVTGDRLTRRYLDDAALGLCGALVCLRGSVGIPGGGLNLMNVSPFAVSGAASPKSLERLTGGGEGGMAALFCHGNPVPRLTGGEIVRRRLAELPLVVQLGGCADETSDYAHVQLPVTTWLEEAGLVAPNNGRALQWRDDIVEPRGQCRPVLDIWTDLAEACGLEATFAWEAERGAPLARAAADHALACNALTRGMTVADLEPEKTPPGGVLWPCIEADDLRFEDDRYIRGDVRGRNILFRRNSHFVDSDHRFPTADGKVAFAPPSAVADDDGEDGEDELLRMVASVAVDYIDGWSGFALPPSAPDLGIIVRIHPRTAATASIGNGKIVVVRNDKGEFRGTAEHSQMVDPRVVWCVETPGRTRAKAPGMSPIGLFEVDDGVRRAFAEVSVIAFNDGETV